MLNLHHPYSDTNVSERSIFNQQKTHKVIADLLAHNAQMAVIGLGYVGLPLALEFARKLDLVGFDIKQNRVSMMNANEDPSGELPRTAFHNRKINFTANVNDLAEAKFYIVAVPTPVDVNKKPNLNTLISATQMVGTVLKKGDYVVFESTVYPGCTEEVCQPILESNSGLKAGVDFKIGYSPERINPGDKKHTLTKITKVVSGCDQEACDVIADVYSMIIEAGVHPATSIKVAEASKIIENTQRDINIALMNELSMIFEKVGIRTQDVLDAAGTKWNFLKFYPGLVGGHCIGVDPYYLLHKANELGVNTKLIAASRAVNDNMPKHVANRIAKQLREDGIANMDAKILVRGITFKEDVQDIRNSKAAEMVQHLKSMGINVTVEDPQAVPIEVMHEYGIEATANPTGEFDCIVLAVPHKEFKEDTIAKYLSMSTAQPFIFDFRNTIKDVPRGVVYMTL
jgi:UDP-N-acetyl-D-galactosamine dehydrogenase